MFLLKIHVLIIFVSWEAIISKTLPVVYLAYTAGCGAMYIALHYTTPGYLWCMTHKVSHRIVCGLLSGKKNGKFSERFVKPTLLGALW